MLPAFGIAFRTWRRKPWMAALLVATLTIGISGTVVVFSIADLALWHPLPFHDADRLVSLWSYLPQQHTTRSAVRRASLDAWDARNGLFSAIYMYGLDGFTINGHGDPIAVTGARVSRGIFSGLGVRPALGREFDEDDFMPGAEHVIVVSDQLWRSMFGADSASLGSWVNVNDVPYRIVGVMPAHFSFPVTNVRFWIPLAGDSRSGDWFNAAALLAPGVSFEQAAAIAEAIPALYSNDGQTLPAVRVRPFTRRLPQTELVLWILTGAVALILLIAVANAANLLLADAVQRQAEIATRLALGASTTQIARQLLTEACVIAVLAAVAAALVSQAVMDVVAVALRAASHSRPSGRLPSIGVDGSWLPALRSAPPARQG